MKKRPIVEERGFFLLLDMVQSILIIEGMKDIMDGEEPKPIPRELRTHITDGSVCAVIGTVKSLNQVIFMHSGNPEGFGILSIEEFEKQFPESDADDPDPELVKQFAEAYNRGKPA